MACGHSRSCVGTRPVPTRRGKIMTSVNQRKQRLSAFIRQIWDDGEADAADGYIAETYTIDRIAHRLHQLLVEPDCARSSASRPSISPDLTDGGDRRAELGAAGRARAALVQRGRSSAWRALRMLIGPFQVKACPLRPERRRQHAIEHVDPALDRADQIVGLAHAHQVARRSAGNWPGAKSSVANIASCPSPTASPPIA
jgi:hypothetical protein